MKLFLFVLLVVLLAHCSKAEDTGCSLLQGNLLMKRGDAFDIGEACLRIRCQGNDQYKIDMGCEIRWRGAPTDVYKKEIKELAENVKKGRACGNL